MKQQHDKKKVNVEFGIHGIQILQFSLDNTPEHQTLGSNHPYTFEINSGVLFDPSLQLIAIDFNVKLFTNKDKNDKVCELTVRMSFNIVNYDEVVKTENEIVTIPDPVMHHLIAVTLSSARGILFEKLQGSFLSHIILPIFNVTQFERVNN